MFKEQWEKTSLTHPLPHAMEQMVQLAYPYKRLISYEWIAGGCANLNIKVLLEDKKQSLIQSNPQDLDLACLRIYLRDKDAAYREQKLAALLKETVPVPLTYYIGELKGYHFALTEFMPGLPLRDLLLGSLPYDLNAIMHEVGMTLSSIASRSFLQAGFLDKELRVMPYPCTDILK